jgi:hypothetical protein
MPHFCFHTAGFQSWHASVDIDLPDRDAARIEAARVLGELVRDEPRLLWEAGGVSVTVEEEGRKLFAVSAHPGR